MSQSRFDPFARQLQGPLQPKLRPGEVRSQKARARRSQAALDRSRRRQEAKRQRDDAFYDVYYEELDAFLAAGVKPGQDSAGVRALSLPTETVRVKPRPPVVLLTYGVSLDELGDAESPEVRAVCEGLEAKRRCYEFIPWPSHPGSHLKALGIRDAIVFVAPGPDEGNRLACDLGSFVLAGVRLILVPLQGKGPLGWDLPRPATRRYYKGQSQHSVSPLSGNYETAIRRGVFTLSWKPERWSYEELAATTVPTGACGTMMVFNPDQLLAVGLMPPDDVEYPLEVDPSGFRFDELRPGYVDWLVGCPWLYGQFRDKLRAFHAHPQTQERLGNLAADTDLMTGPNLFFPGGWYDRDNRFLGTGYAMPRGTKTWGPVPKTDPWLTQGYPTWIERPGEEDPDPTPDHWLTGFSPWVLLGMDPDDLGDDEEYEDSYYRAPEEAWDWTPPATPDCRHGIQPEDERLWDWLTTRQKDRLSRTQADGEVRKRLVRRQANAWRQGLKALQAFERLASVEREPQDDDAERLEAAARLITPDVSAWLRVKHLGHSRVIADPVDARLEERVSRGTDRGYKAMWRATMNDATTSLLLELRAAYRQAKEAIEGTTPQTEDDAGDSQEELSASEARAFRCYNLTRVG